MAIIAIVTRTSIRSKKNHWGGGASLPVKNIARRAPQRAFAPLSHALYKVENNIRE